MRGGAGRLAVPRGPSSIFNAGFSDDVLCERWAWPLARFLRGGLQRCTGSSAPRTAVGLARHRSVVGWSRARATLVPSVCTQLSPGALCVSSGAFSFEEKGAAEAASVVGADMPRGSDSSASPLLKLPSPLPGYQSSSGRRDRRSGNSVPRLQRAATIRPEILSPAGSEPP